MTELDKNRHFSDKKGTASKRFRQQAFIAAYLAGGFHVGRACAEVGINRSTFCVWQKTDAKFLEAFHDGYEELLDEWEAQLHRNIMAGDTTSVIFALKTRGKERGYTERESVNRQTVKIIERIQSGELSEIDAGYEFAKLGLPLPEVLKLRLGRLQIEASVENEFIPMSEEEIERRANERIAAVQQQREQFLPQRRAEVAEIKERLKDMDSFAPERFEGE